MESVAYALGFWSSVDLTGNQTIRIRIRIIVGFWSSVDLTGNQTIATGRPAGRTFWSSVDLTGNQTGELFSLTNGSFGAVSI